MKYVSELTKKTYNSEEECLEAEKVYKNEQANIEEKRAQRKSEAEEVAKAYTEYKKVSADAYKKFIDLRDKFIAKYGSWHMSYTQRNDENPLVSFDEDKSFDLFNRFIDWLL